MSPAVLLLVYCTLILVSSLAGGWIPHVVRLTHRRMEITLSFVSGVMLGIAVLHLLPHALLEAQPSDASGHGHGHGHEVAGPVFRWLLAGFLAMFFVERFFCFHHHEAPSGGGGIAAGGSAERKSAAGAVGSEELDGEGPVPLREASGDGRDHDDHHADHHHACGLGQNGRHTLTWSGAAVGLTVHTLIAGVALAASVESQERLGGAAALAGLSTFFVIFLHKPFDALTIAALMSAGRHSNRSRHLVNILFSLAIPVGVVLFYLGLDVAGEASKGVLSAALAFSAGTFLCISLSDVLPELQFHRHDRFKLSLALLLGILVSWGVSMLEG